VARALFGKPRLLLLDEAASSVDPPTAQALMDMLHRVAADKEITCVHVSHSLELLNHMDRIILFDHGHIVEQGSYRALVADSTSRFSRLLNRRIGGWHLLRVRGLPLARFIKQSRE